MIVSITNLDIKVNDFCYRENRIEAGLYIKEFFCLLANNIFEHSLEYFNEYVEGRGSLFVPILEKERNFGSTLACAINMITPIHLSEWTFPEKKRRVDFWCQTSRDDKIYNYFIEAKQAYQSIEKDNLYYAADKGLSSLIDQIYSIKNDIMPEWSDRDIFLGIMIIPCGCEKNKVVSKKFNENNLLDNIAKKIDKRSGIQILMSTWYLPNNMKKVFSKAKDWDWTYECVSIVGLVLTKKIRT